ncbi:NAD-dependent malate dehydrogenase [Dunaliella salina]|uniref:Malate dehydrogenase n=1 Tax=Dunaliella salina TaxID=3046 RepID=A0ABQ7FY15_DUNSA|nr:NAD-dependent malate dehydrogenase [Dunaliella salina]|eukprot:KAF5827255.1 NAD-dependent malate dehydrogenase [Dunaliella salina]
MLGPNQPVILHLLDIEPAKDALMGVQMELMDAALPLLQGVHTFTSVEQASVGVDVAIMVGGVPRKPGEERKDVMAKNSAVVLGALEIIMCTIIPTFGVSQSNRVLLAAANTNAWVLKENSPGIPAENITCLTRLDHNRAIAQVGERAGVHSTAVKNVIIWGNHSSTQFPDVSHGSVAGQPIKARLQGDSWLEEGFISTVQQRGAAILKARGLSSALSAASSVCDHVRDWMLGTPKGSWVSMGVVSDGSYGITPGLVFSYPVRCCGGKWSIVQGLQLDEPSLNRLRTTEQELLEEREMALASAGVR